MRWERIRIYFADERAVAPHDADSNFALVRRTLLDLLPERPAGVFRMEGDAPRLREAVKSYERLLPDRIDLLVLGIGEDGHTASLFPGSSALLEEARRVAITSSPSPPRLRLTITPVVIRAARRVVVLVQGTEKAAPVAEALRGRSDVSACPARLARGGTWVLDSDAAQLLSEATR